jgi:hypothetical protein
MALRVIAAAIALLVSACSTNASRHQADYDALRRTLPGIYANTADAQSSSERATAVRLAITPVIAQAIGDPVYFVRETAAGNEHLVLAERIWTLALDKQNRMVQQMFVFKEPRRWVGAAEHQDLLLGLLPQDLTLLSGCDLIWNRKADADPSAAKRPPSGFAAAPLHTPDPCEPGPSTQGQWVEREFKLEGSQLAVSARQVGSDGSLAASAGVTALTLQRHGSASGVSSPKRPGF